MLDIHGVFLYTDSIMITKIKITKKQLKEYKEHNKQVQKSFKQINKICKRFNISQVEFIKKVLL
ncbi:hypothetical protein HTVC033P_gp06 [Pelagibacter phage HTVC033P]|nr:hypothetical protein HTVC033P_gp06 [Pelagibacter phage HTVC033P]